MYGGRHLSRADFSILCAIVAAETGIEYHNRNSTACIKRNKGCMPKVLSKLFTSKMRI